MSFHDDLCAYYTPDGLAQDLVGSISVPNPRVVLDPAAGDGALLVAAAARFQKAKVVAIDLDRAAGRRLQRRLPSATVSICDVLSETRIARSKAWAFKDEVDVVVANPPFGSLKGPRRATVGAWGEHVRCGIAVAHLVAAVATFAPLEVLALVPDSMLHSERDRSAVEMLSSRYRIDVLRSLGNSSFSRAGASVNVVRMSRGAGARRPEGRNAGKWHRRRGIGPVRLIRGGMPLHDVKEAESGGVPLLHTTNLIGSKACRMVKPLGRGVVAGPAIFLPRVGLPKEEHLVPKDLTLHQLSDCVIALLCESYSEACNLSRNLERGFGKLLTCWRGTGAQYTTMGKLRECLEELGIVVVEGP